jgi:hypothetical protein
LRRLKKGTDKYKGKLPSKCFNCGKIGHFSSKCPYARGLNSDNEEEVPKKEKKYQKKKKEKKRNKIKFSKKSLYSTEDSSSYSEDIDNDNDSERVLFVEMETQE